MQALIEQAQSSVIECGGYCTWPFSQLTEPVAGILAGHPDTLVTGLCEMLSARWIERHANGSSLVSWLSSANGSIDRSKVRQLMQLTIIGNNMKSGMIAEQDVGSVRQLDATVLWLQHHGIEPCRVMTLDGAGGVRRTTVDTRYGERNERTRRTFAGEIAVSIQKDLCTCSNNYALMGVYGHTHDTKAHTMAAWVGQDVCLFDPNFGEFYFHDRQSFINWFPTFFRRATYVKRINNHCEFYETLIMAPAKPLR